MSEEKWVVLREKEPQDNYMDIRILPPNPQYWILMMKSEKGYVCADPSEARATRFITLDIGDKRGDQREAGIQGIAFVRGVLHSNVIFELGQSLPWKDFRSQKVVIEYSAIEKTSNSSPYERIDAALTKYRTIIIDFLNKEYGVRCIKDIAIESKDKDFQMLIYLDPMFIDALRTLVFRPVMNYQKYSKDEVMAGEIVEREHINPFIVHQELFSRTIAKHHEHESEDYYKALAKMEETLHPRKSQSNEVWKINTVRSPKKSDRLTVLDVFMKGVYTEGRWEKRAVIIPDGENIYLGRQIKDIQTKGFSDLQEIESVLNEIDEDMRTIYWTKAFDSETQSYTLSGTISSEDLAALNRKGDPIILKLNAGVVLPAYKAKLRIRRLIFLVRRVNNPNSALSNKTTKQKAISLIKQRALSWGFDDLEKQKKRKK